MKNKLSLENLAFWIIIILLIALAVWMISGSPTDTSAIIAIAVFVAASEILLWKSLFSIDKKTAIGFEKIRNDIDSLKKEIRTNTLEIKEMIRK